MRGQKQQTQKGGTEWSKSKKKGEDYLENSNWNSPVPLRTDKSALPDFPLTCLPLVPQAMAVGVAETTSTDISMSATALLSALSFCFSGVYRMFGKADHSEPLTLYSLMQKLNYEIKQGKYISFRAEGQERFIRSKTLGTDYTEERLRERISGARTNPSISLIIDIENCFKDKQRNPEAFRQWATVQNLKTMANTVNYLTEKNMLSYSALSGKHTALKEKYNADRTCIKEIEQRLKVIAEDIKNIDNYRKHKPVADKLESVVFKEKYKREHESELIIFTAAEKYLKKRFDGEKAPLIKELRAEQKKLYAEKDKLYSSYNAAKTEIKELDMIMKNVDMILGKDKEKDRRRDVQRGRSGELE